jgi:hypothetical protein
VLELKGISDVYPMRAKYSQSCRPDVIRQCIYSAGSCGDDGNTDTAIGCDECND